MIYVPAIKWWSITDNKTVLRYEQKLNHQDYDYSTLSANEIAYWFSQAAVGKYLDFLHLALTSIICFLYFELGDVSVLHGYIS